LALVQDAYDNDCATKLIFTQRKLLSVLNNTAQGYSELRFIT